MGTRKKTTTATTTIVNATATNNRLPKNSDIVGQLLCGFYVVCITVLLTLGVQHFYHINRLSPDAKNCQYALLTTPGIRFVGSSGGDPSFSTSTRNGNMAGAELSSLYQYDTPKERFICFSSEVVAQIAFSEMTDYDKMRTSIIAISQITNPVAVNKEVKNYRTEWSIQ